jgi:hypothetical protein
VLIGVHGETVNLIGTLGVDYANSAGAVEIPGAELVASTFGFLFAADSVNSRSFHCNFSVEVTN